MKIAISAESADLEAEVARRFGTSKYLVVVDLDSGDSEAVPNPGASAQRGAGMQAVVLAISKDVKAVLTGYCSPAINNHLIENGIEVVSGLSGTVGEVVERYKKGDFRKHKEVELEYRPRWSKIDKPILSHAIRSSAKQFATMLPILVGVVLLLRDLREKGAGNSFMAIFLGNRAVKPFLLPVMISYFGWIYVLILTVFTITASVVTGYSVGVLVKERSSPLSHHSMPWK